MGGTPNYNSSEQSKEESNSINKELTFGDTFTFDDLEIVIHDDLKFTKVDNEYSDHHGTDVVKIPVTITNKKSETHGLNQFSYKIYGSKGTLLERISYYFDGNVDAAGDMRSGATQETFFVALYDGDGDYYIEFDDYSTTTEVKLPIKKS